MEIPKYEFPAEFAPEMQKAVEKMVELKRWQDKAFGACWRGDLELAEKLWPGVTTGNEIVPHAFQEYYDASMELLEKVRKVTTANLKK